MKKSRFTDSQIMAIPEPGDGQKGLGQTWHQYPFSLRVIWHQRDLLSLPGKTRPGEHPSGIFNSFDNEMR